ATLQMTGRVLASKRMDNQAEFVLERLLREYPDHLPGYTEYAEVLVDQGRIDDAVTILDRGLARFPGNPVLLNDLGMCRLMQHDLAGATQAFKGALEADPRDAVYVGNCALVAALSGDEEAARELWGRIVSRSEVETNLRIARGARGAFGKAGS
ncbi:MAG: tetratricopeptide repeat protein, partial [Phycisphaerales bacterium]|nr:tetratricopeptide repeat protein [Phycisphaerales bacterium]